MIRRTATAAIAITSLAVPAGNAWASFHAAPKKGTVVGPSVPCDKWGPLQLTLTYAKTGTKVRITGVQVKWPDHTHRSVYINDQAGPLLIGELMQVQSPKIEMISGATDTSVSFIESLKGALAKIK